LLLIRRGSFIAKEQSKEEHDIEDGMGLY